MENIKRFIPAVLFLLLACNFYSGSNGGFYIRTSQIGYRPGDIKSAVVFSDASLDFNDCSVIDAKSGKTVYRGRLENSSKKFGRFSHIYTFGFSGLKNPGEYLISADGQKSYPFKIKDDVFNHVRDSLMLFFKEQRCGPTGPILHEPCHLSDVSRVIGDPDYKGRAVDATGGWHDAGDYIKFLSTSSFTTYMLIFSYEFDKDKFGFDNNKNGVPDVLEEAKIGLDWMLRCNYSPYKLITQVQDLRDHNVGWRMPGDDTLRYDRPGYVSMGKNQIGLFTAVMATASRVWRKEFSKTDFADKCLKAAERLYSIRNNVPDDDSSQSGAYQDDKYLGKLALGAAELYKTTGDKKYLDDAVAYGDSAGSDYWWSWGNINSLADYAIAQNVPRFANYILNNLEQFEKNEDKSAFGEGLPYTWGTTNSLLGVSLQAILYKKLTGYTQFDTLAGIQRDYVAGRNPWGLSFIYGIGTKYPLHFHSQVAYFHGGYLPGALSAGPAPARILSKNKITGQNHTYDIFNSDSVKYYDDRNDYITNEPTITGNATALFVYGYYSKK